MPRRPLVGMVFASLILVGCGDTPAGETAAAGEMAVAGDVGTVAGPGSYPVAPRAEEVQPVGLGQAAPTATLRTPDGRQVDLAGEYARAPTVLIFYRGGWCPFCSVHLGEIALIQDELEALGVQVLAVSPDRPEKLQESVADRQLEYQLLSDSDMALTRAFGLAFQLDDEQVAQYASSGFDLSEASGHDHHQLPVPAAYVVDREGVIRFAHWDPNFRERIDGDALLAAVRESL